MARGTVKTHLEHVYAKTGLRNRTNSPRPATHHRLDQEVIHRRDDDPSTRSKQPTNQRPVRRACAGRYSRVRVVTGVRWSTTGERLGKTAARLGPS